MSKIEVKDLYLIFGAAKKQAMKMLKAGKEKEYIKSKTNCTIAVNNVNLSINEGEIFVIMGLSGSGKSSLLRTFNMLNVPTSGSICVGGKDITKMHKKDLLQYRRKEVGMVFQHFGLLPHKTILENIAFGLEIQEIKVEERFKKAQEVIDLVGLSGYENSFPHQLSGGMQQRVGIARALATDSKMLLMDEAFSALDPLIRSQMQDDLIEIHDKLKKTIIFITHDLDEALKMGDHIAIMKDGVIVQQGEPEEILMNPADDYVRDFIGNVDMGKVITASTMMNEFPERITLGKDGPAYAARMMSKHRLRFMAVADKDKTFRGYIRQKDVNKLIEQKNHDLESIIIDIPKVSPDTLIADLLPLYINQKYPLAIINEKGKALGYLSHSNVVAMVTGYSDDEVQEMIESAQ